MSSTQPPSSYNPTDVHGSQEASGTESPGDSRDNGKKRAFGNVLKRSHSTSVTPTDNRTIPSHDPQRSLSPPPVVEDTPISRYWASMNSAESLDNQGWFSGFLGPRRSDSYPGFAPGATTMGFPNFPNHIVQHWIGSNKIYFYHKHEPFYGFTNFSPHSVMYKGKKYHTSEHLFQSFKFINKPKLAEHIRTCSSRPSVAFSEARRFAPEVREDWSDEKVKINAMEITIYHKFTQHKDIRRQLLATGDAELIENSDKDSYWGCGADGKGQNQLGQALERLRTKLRKERR